MRKGIEYLDGDLLRKYKVSKWRYFDSEGLVYGHSSKIDVDILISDDKHVIIEYKAFVDRSNVAELHRIGKLYEKVTGIKPYLLIITPNIRKRAKELADALNIEVRGNIID